MFLKTSIDVSEDYHSA